MNSVSGALLALVLAVSCLAAAEKAPDFSLKDLNGKTVKLSDLKGKVVFLDFWASWCPPCQSSTPAVEKLHKKYADRNVAVLGINVENDPAAAKNYVQKAGMTYPVLLADNKTTRAYKIGGIPAFFVISPDGTIARKIVGYSSGLESQWNKEIDTLLGTSTKSPK